MTRIFVPIKRVSERIPGKNFRDFGGLPLWQHTLQKYRDDSVFVDTDSAELLEQLKNWPKVVAYFRPSELVGHQVSVNLLIQHWLNEYVTDDAEAVVQLHATSPFLTRATVLAAVNLWGSNGDDDSIVGSHQIQARCWQAGKDGDRHPVALNHDPRVLQPTQDLSPVIIDNSTFYIFTKRTFMRNNNRVGRTPRFFPVSFPEHLDIDTPDEWDLCERVVVYEQLKNLGISSIF